MPDPTAVESKNLSSLLKLAGITGFAADTVGVVSLLPMLLLLPFVPIAVTLISGAVGPLT